MSFGEERGATHHAKRDGESNEGRVGEESREPAPAKNGQAQIGGAAHDGKQESDGWRHRRFQA